MSDLYQTSDYKGYTINIYFDEDAENPREFFDGLGTMYTAHRRYRPEKSFDDHFEFEKVFDKHVDFRDSFLRENIALKMYLYDHSGLSVRTTPFNDRWDSGLFGIIAVSKEKVKKVCNWKIITKSRREKIESYLENEVELLNMYYTGEVYRYEILDESDDPVESCSGYYGDESIESMISECKETIDYTIREEEKKREKESGNQLVLEFC